MYALIQCWAAWCAVGTWPGLAITFNDFAAAEVDAALKRKKPPDSSLSRAFKKLVQLADQAPRAGEQCTPPLPHCCFLHPHSQLHLTLLLLTPGTCIVPHTLVRG